MAARPDPADRADRAAARLAAAVAALDTAVERQLNAVLAHPDFQKLEAAWRGLRYLVDQLPEAGGPVRVRVLSATWGELAKDQERAIEFDQSHLFRRVYSDEFGTPGGTPYGLLVGDYAVPNRPAALAALAGVAAVAAAAFAPFVAAVTPGFLGVDQFAEIDPMLDAGRLTDGDDHRGWRSFRQSEDSRFVGLAVPRVLLRSPHTDPPGHGHGFPFRQPAGAGVYGSGAWAVAAVVVRAFADTGWLAAVRGAGGAAPELAHHDPRPEVGFAAPVAADAAFTDRQEKELADLGLIPLVHQPGAGGAVVYTMPSAQRPKAFDGAGATANAKLSAMLPHVLCASRVAHYLKVLCRDRIGSFTSPHEVADALRQWVRRYVVSNDSASPELKARHPLRDAKVEVWEIPGRPGHYRCTMHLQPHYQLDALAAGIRLTTELTAGTG